MSIIVRKADITTLDVDAIVNAANESLAAGGGVCGAIFRAAGPSLQEACDAVAPCPTGEARITPGFALKARHVIHAVGPVWHGGARGEAEKLQACYESIFTLVEKHHLKSVALPAISTGIFGYPLIEATRIAMKTAKRHDRPELAITFACFSDEAKAAYEDALRSR